MMPILYSHRGNINGPNKTEENTPSYIDEALKNYHVECDLWSLNGRLYLGHDEPDQPIVIEWLGERAEKLLLHAKNLEALEEIVIHGFHGFYHEHDKHTLTTRQFIVTYPGEQLGDVSIAMLPEVVGYVQNYQYCYGVCSDYIGRFKPLKQQ